MSIPPYRGRFAPSPTGPLHLGSLLAALGSWLMARHCQGEWLIRIEDLDPPREISGMAQQQLNTLAAFGLSSDLPVLWQSAHHEHYAAALQQLQTHGAVFECRCSRTELSPYAGIHRHCVDSIAERAPAIRLRMPDIALGFEDSIRGRFSQNLADDVGDVVLQRADGYWAYQLAVVIDDATQGITDVVRGADLLDSTPRQIYLQQQLGLATPRYAHLPLLIDQNGNKLSKSIHSMPVDATEPKPALHKAWQLLGQEPRALDGAGNIDQWLARALRNFQPKNISRVNVKLSATD